MKMWVMVALLGGLLAGPAWASAEQCKADFERDDAAAALESCGAAVSANPEDADSWAIRGAALLAANQTEAAMAAVDRALGVNPAHTIALANRAQLQFKAGNHSAALEDLERGLKAAPKDYGLLWLGASMMEALDRKPEAIAYLERAAKAGPESAEPWLRLAKLSQGGDARQVERYLDRAVKASDADPAARHQRGHWWESQKKWGKAEDDYRAAIKIAPQEPHLYLDLARVLRLDADLPEALKVLDQGLALQPDLKLLVTRLELRAEANDAAGALADAQAVTGLSTHAELNTRARAHAEEAVLRRYAPGLPAALEGLKRVAVDDNTCAFPSVDDELVEDFVGWLMIRENVAEAEGRLAQDVSRRYHDCLEEVEPEPTTTYADVRQAIQAALTAVNAGMPRLMSDCAAHPAAQSLCAEVAQRYTGEAQGLMDRLRALEDKASARRIEIARLRKEAPAKAAQIAAAAEKAFAATAKRHFEQTFTAERASRVESAKSLFRGPQPPQVDQRCPAPPRESAHSDTPVHVVNQRGAVYFECLKKLENETKELVPALSVAEEDLYETRSAIDALAEYRCSRRSGGCIPDNAWDNANMLVPAALVSQAESKTAAYARLIDAVSARREAYNDWIASLNREIDQLNAEREREEDARAFANALQGFADTLQQSNQRNSGGYYDSSTSAPGIR